MENELICARCGIKQSERNRLPPMATGINHPEYCYTKSFSTQDRENYT